MGLSFAVFVACAMAWSQLPLNPQPQPPILVSARAAHDITPAEAARGYKVRLKATVSYYDPYIDKRHGALFVCDATGCIFVPLPVLPILSLKAGDLVEVTGVTGAADYAPVLDHAEIRRIGNSELPRNASRPSFSQLLTGNFDGHWIEMDGVVHAIHLTKTNATLDLATDGGTVSATTVRKEGENYQSLVDASVRIRANAAPQFNRRRQMVGAHLFFPSFQVVKILQPAPSDPLAVVETPVSHLLRYSPAQQSTHRVRVRGTVTLQWPDGTLCIEQNGGGLCMSHAQGEAVALGSLIDVLGFPAISDYKATLDDAVYWSVGSTGPAPIPRQATLAQASSEEIDGELIQLEGEIIGQDRSADTHVLILRSGESVFLASLPIDPKDPGVSDWRVGSRLRLTGVSNLQVDTHTTNLHEGAVRPGTVRLLLRSPADVQLLKSPSWWTPEHAVAVIAVVCVLSMAALAWVVVLRRRVRQQTQALRESEERLRHISEHDPLTNLPNRNLLNDRLKMALYRAQRFQKGLALLMIDVDFFKEVNDALGHRAGDLLLCELANRFSAAVRKTDTVARIGGDEFLVVLPDLKSFDDALSITNKILASVSTPINIGEEQVTITISVGVCTYPQAGKDAEGLMQSVDAAMYDAKAKGRNGFQIYQPVPQV